MKRRPMLASIPFIMITVLVASAPAAAVRFGVPDGGEHPFVGLVAFFDEGGDYQWRCTGALISPTVLLTAAHCAELAAGARIWFDEDVDALGPFPDAGAFVTGTAHPYPGWNGGFLPDTGDVGVVVLDEPVESQGVGRLADARHLGALARRRGKQVVTFEVVGYGVQSVKPRSSALLVKLKADVQLVNLRSALNGGYNLQTTNAKGRGTGGGGICFGDSGGPIFHRGVIVAVNSFVANDNCAGTSYGYRTDRQAVIDWVMSFIQS